jgi:hypothetical protein
VWRKPEERNMQSGNIRIFAISVSIATMLLLNEVFPTPWYVWIPAGLLAYLIVPVLVAIVMGKQRGR